MKPRPRVYTVDALGPVTITRLMSVTGMNGLDARACLEGDRMLTLVQADRAAIAVGAHIDILWPNVPTPGTVTIGGYTVTPLRPKPKQPYEPRHHVVALREAGLTVAEIASCLHIHTSRIRVTLAERQAA